MLDERTVINGSYGEVWSEGTWLTNVTSAEAVIEIGKEEINRAGTRWVGHKVTSVTGSGTLSGYKVSTAWIEKVASVLSNRGRPFVTELIIKLDDPESLGAMRARLSGVSFDRIDIANYEAGSLVEEELPFTFSGFELLDRIPTA